MKDKENLQMATSKEFNLQIKIKRYPELDYYWVYGEDDNLSDPENACYYVAGGWLIGNVVFPALLGTGNYSQFRRTILHELSHHRDNISKHDYYNATRIVKDAIGRNRKKEYYYYNKFKTLYPKRSAFFLNCLYNMLFELRDEGLAEFEARKDNPIDVNLSAINTFNQNVIILSTLRKAKQTEDFFDTNIGLDNQTPTGEYANGRNMCLTIALAIAHERSKSKKIKNAYNIIIDRTILPSDKASINDALSTNKTIYFTDIDKESVIEAIQKIKPTGHYYFLQEYEKACDILKIKEEYRIMTRRRFYNIVSESIKKLEKEKKSRLESGGFDYIESGIKPL